MLLLSRQGFTVSFWVKTAQTDPNACLVSYASATNTSWTVPLAICNPTNLELFINADSSASGLATFVNVSDNQWHFVAFTWSPDDGRVVVYDNGMLAFDGGPYRVGKTVEAGGVLVLGHLVLSTTSGSSPCSIISEVNLSVSSSDAQGGCQVVEGAGLVGSMQHVHLWSRRLSRTELLKELAWPQVVVSNALVLGWNFDSAYLQSQGRIVADFALKGQQRQYPGFVHCPRAANSSSATCIFSGEIPSINQGFPCGQVYSNLWHFAAPDKFIDQLPNAYGGRLQFRMFAPSFNGAPRPRRGRLSIFTSDGLHSSLSLGTFALPSASVWTHYSAVLREDFGWIDEPSGASLATNEFKQRLAKASALWIRGDLWGYDATGPGQEIVYLNDVALFSR